MKQHKWHKEIKAWADGAEIEFRYFTQSSDKWSDWEVIQKPTFSLDNDCEYRIKPQPKQPQYLYVYKMMTNEGLKIQFWDSKTYRDESYLGKIKLEVDDEKL